MSGFYNVSPVFSNCYKIWYFCCKISDSLSLAKCLVFVCLLASLEYKACLLLQLIMNSIACRDQVKITLRSRQDNDTWIQRVIHCGQISHFSTVLCFSFLIKKYNRLAKKWQLLEKNNSITRQLISKLIKSIFTVAVFYVSVFLSCTASIWVLNVINTVKIACDMVIRPSQLYWVAKLLCSDFVLRDCFF